jgi:hypothetical protein
VRIVQLYLITAGVFFAIDFVWPRDTGAALNVWGARPRTP